MPCPHHKKKKKIPFLVLDSVKNVEGGQEDKNFLTLTSVLIGILELCIPREEFISRVTVTVETSWNILAFSI